MSSYVYRGHEIVGSHVSRCLEPLGWTRVEDASAADVAFTCCLSQTALEDAYFDDEGLVKGSRPGTLLVDFSPSTPSFARELAAVATVNDLRPVEAPLSVIDPALPDAFGASGNIACYVAGEDDDVDEVIDVLETIAGTVERTGASGTAQLAKATRTAQAATLIAGAIEADALARATAKAGLVEEGRAHALPATAALVGAVAADDMGGNYTVEMLMAEVAAACSAAEEVELIVPQLETVMHLLEVIAVIGGAEKSPAALSLVYREEADSAANGLDWTRAEHLFADGADAHEHDHDLEDGDDFGFYGGFGGYSAN